MTQEDRDFFKKELGATEERLEKKINKSTDDIRVEMFSMETRLNRKIDGAMEKVARDAQEQFLALRPNTKLGSA